MDNNEIVQIDCKGNQVGTSFQMENIGKTTLHAKSYERVNGEWYMIEIDEKDSSPCLLHFYEIAPEDLTKIDPSKIYVEKEKIELYDTLGDIKNDGLYGSLITSFNASNDKYYLDVLENTNGIEATDLLAKESPDILFTFFSFEIEHYQKNGYLENLIPLLNSIDQEDISPLAYKEFGDDKALYALPRDISMTTLVCMDDNLQGKEGWNAEEFLDWIEKSQTIYSSENMDRSMLVYIIMLGNLEEYVDFEKREVYFNGEAFKSIVKRIHDLSYQVEEVPYGEVPKTGNYIEIFEGGSTSLLASMEYQTGRKCVCMGYPNENRDAKSVLAFMPSFSVLKNSNHKEAAVEFIEYVIAQSKNDLESEKSANNKTSGMVWPLNSMTEMDFSQTLGNHETTYIKDDDLVTEIEFVCTQEHVEKEREIMNNAVAIGRLHFEIMGYVQEEVDYYLHGEKDLDAVCDYLQSVVQVMVNE